jgi:acetyl esterase/lipase
MPNNSPLHFQRVFMTFWNFHRKALAPVALAAAIAGVSSHGIGQETNSQEPVSQTLSLTPTFDVRCLANQRYSQAEGKAGLCDVYLPRQKNRTNSKESGKGRPAIVVVHGGAWMTGDKWTLEGYSRLLARHGFVVVTINYRLAPTHKFPSQVDDVREALIWTASRADKFAIDLDRLGLFGYSAGGHLSALVGMLADEPAEVQQQASRWKSDDPRWKSVPKVHAICAGGPPCDFRDLPLDNTGLAYFLGGSRRAKPLAYNAASPTAHASIGDPPLQIIHGEADFLVPIASSRGLQAAMKKLGRDVRVEVLPGQGHMSAFMAPATRHTMLEFFQSVFLKPKLSVWDINLIAAAPEVRWVNRDAPIRELIYQGPSVDGHETEVFAFYATPGSIAGDPSLDKNLPAVVLVHGGGGTAFAPWVWLWAKRGYAAIAMDLSGRRPLSPQFTDGELQTGLRVETTRLENGGPAQGHQQKFFSVGGTLEDDWPYHAVGNVIRAHSLIRSFREIDAERTAITGISWGGYTTCIAASIDDRFKAAVPVYGCGFLHDGESVQRKSIDALGENQRTKWIQQYDPSSHLPHCLVPILFVNGTNDKHYPLRSYSRSFSLVTKEKHIRIEPNMKHSHQAGWTPKEIGIFIDSQLRGGDPLPKLGQCELTEGNIKASLSSKSTIQSATLHFTTDGGPLLTRKWQSQAAVANDDSVTARDVPGATILYLSVTDERGAMVSTDVIFSEQEK